MNIMLLVQIFNMFSLDNVIIFFIILKYFLKF